GTVLVGRLHEDLDYWGLANLGYVGGFDPIFSALSPFDDAGNIDGIRYTNRWDNGFQLIAQYSKMRAIDWQGARVRNDFGAGNWASDSDYDRIEVEGAYFWDGGGASLGVRYDRDANNVAYRGANANVARYADGTTSAWYLNPAIMHSWGDFSIHFEGKFGWGTTDRVLQTAALANPGAWGLWDADDRDASGYGLYLDLDYNYGPGNVTLAGWWVSGTELGDAANQGWDGRTFQDNDSLVDMGGNFIPLVVAYNGNAYGWGRVGAQAGNANAVSLANNGFANYINPAYDATAGLNPNGFMYGSAAPANIVNALTTANITKNNLLNASGFGNAGVAPLTITSNPFMRRDNSWNEGTMANHWGLTLGGNHAFTDDISMHYAVGYLALNEPNYRAVNSVSVQGVRLAGGAGDADTVQLGYGYAEQDKDLGFEIDLGFTFQLLDNLRFTTMFGYMFTGDAYKNLKGYTYTQTRANGGAANDGYGAGVMNAVWEDGDDAYVWENTLQFNF
ncbi:hypothetical protein LJB86_06125, partial [Deltaproteobacteria bacterium OttesenSCG-928-M10]|nr:hypothetical protein [Deltaproteobacteria bacterium OttesenSCG-928-M10]